MKGLVGGAAAGYSLAPAEVHTPQAQNGLKQRRHKETRSAVREQGRSKTGIASLHVKLAPMSAPGPSGERQEHLDAIIPFEGAGQRRQLFRILEIPTVKWPTGDLPEESFSTRNHVPEGRRPHNQPLRRRQERRQSPQTSPRSA